MDNPEPEFDSVEARGTDGTDGAISVDVSVRSIRSCADCGSELKSLDLQLGKECNVREFSGWDAITPEEQAEVIAGLENGEVEIETSEGDTSQDEGGGGRYAKNMISVEVSVDLQIDVYRNKGTDTEQKISLQHTVEMSEENQASAYEECC